MNCREASLISPYLDGTLPEEEVRTLQAHLVECRTCSDELHLQQQLSEALRKMGQVEIQAPPELCGQIMGRLRQDKRTKILRLPVAWRKAAAAAAAMVLLAGGSAGLTSGLKTGGVGKMLGFHSPAAVETGAPNDPVATPQPGDPAAPSGSVNIASNTGEAGNTTGHLVDSTVLPDSGAVTGDAPSNPAGPEKIPAGQIRVSSTEGARALLSTGMKVTSTVLKVNVDDLTVARAKAVALAAGANAATQVFQEQDGGRKVVVLRLTVSSGSAVDLIGGLMRLGTTVDRQDESRDVTSLYNETLVRYFELQAARESAGDPQELRRLETQAASYRQQLDAWEAEAGKRIITLWLESK